MKIALPATLATLLILYSPVDAQTQAQPGWILDEKGCRHWNLNPVPEEKVTWTGDCKNGYAAGRGEQRWTTPNRPDSIYVGTMQEGKLAGAGVYIGETGTRYEGQFLDGRRHGLGTFTLANGARYEGEFARGYMHGRGSVQFPSGNGYKGQFDEGGMKGAVEATWAYRVSPFLLEDHLNPVREQALKPNQLRVPPRLRATEQCTPQYPEYARRMEATGTTEVALLVTPLGKSVKTRVAKSAGDTPAHKLLDFTAAAAFWGCSFDAGKIDGKETEMWVTVEFVWKLQ